MTNLVKKYWKPALLTVIGAGVGFAYWRFIGCSTGTCPITSNWHTSTIMGGLIGIVVAPVLKKEDTNQQKTSEE